MFDDLLKQIKQRNAVMNGEAEPDSSEDTNGVGGTPTYEPDVWVRRGEYIIRKHHKPRDTLFSPTQWLYESGNKAIPIEDNDGHFEFLDLERLDVIRETCPDSTYMGEHWDTWIAHGPKDTKMPTK